MAKFLITISANGLRRELFEVDGTKEYAVSQVDQMYKVLNIDNSYLNIKLCTVNSHSTLTLNKHMLDVLIEKYPYFFVNSVPSIVGVDSVVLYQATDSIINDVIEHSTIITFQQTKYDTKLNLKQIKESVEDIAKDFMYPMRELILNFNNHLKVNFGLDEFLQHILDNLKPKSVNDIRSYLWENSYITAGYLESVELEAYTVWGYGYEHDYVEFNSLTSDYSHTIHKNSGLRVNHMKVENGKEVYGSPVKAQDHVQFLSEQISDKGYTYHKEGDKIVIKNKNNSPEFYINLS